MPPIFLGTEMNIFILDRNIAKNAKYHCNTHVCKMPTEYLQILSTVLHQHGLAAPMKPIRVCNLVEWAGESLANFAYLKQLCIFVCNEYYHRYGKRHSVLDMVLSLQTPSIEKVELTPFVYSKGMEDFYKSDIVDHYRSYYLSKLSQGGWRWEYKNRDVPEWAKSV